MKQVNGNTFRPEELISMRHYDKKNGQWIETDYPKVGGRLRIAHDQNDSISITTEIIKYDGQVAVVKASCTTDKGCYSGIGMASVERDAKIAPAILELAETRAIARALRFSGIGVEYCSAEEISHLEQTHSSTPAGTRVFVCENLCFSGEFLAFRRHTAGLDIDELAFLAYRSMRKLIPMLKTF